MARVCIITEELPHVGRTGGIGAAMHELALSLSANGHHVDLLYHNVSGASDEVLDRAKDIYSESRIRLIVLNCAPHIDCDPTPRAVSYSIYRTLSESAYEYDFVHFPDYKGLAFFPLLAKHQGLAFPSTQFVVQVHGPTRWTIEANGTFFSHEEQVSIDYMERRTIELADKVVAPSAYIADWVNDRLLKNPRDISVIKNLCGDLPVNAMAPDTHQASERSPNKIREIVIFGRHEDRKGIDIACQALSRLSKRLGKEEILVSFIGNMGQVAGQNSLIYLHEVSKNWMFNFDFHFGLNRDDVAAYLHGRDDALVIIPSPYENSPYTVLETLMLGAPLICSIEGGAKELIDERDWELACCTMSAKALAQKIAQTISNGAFPARIAEANADIIKKWCAFHAPIAPENVALDKSEFCPLVTVGITHYERPKKVIDAITSIIKQDYTNIEILVCDDGSSSDDTIEALSRIEVMLNRVGGKLLRRENGYLGAARNTILANATGEYVIFLDDDDIAAGNMVSTLVAAAHRTKVDAVSCLNIFMPESLRGDVLIGAFHNTKVSYFPLGGPVSLSAEQNVFGSATALFSRQALQKVGGYTEVYGVGHEDYELYIRLAIAGCQIEVCPEPLFFYEVGRPSMISSTSLVRNFNRCFEPIAEHMPPEMIDYVNLNAGRTAYRNQHNRAWWLNSQKPTSEIRHELQNQEMTIERALERAETLAQEEGNHQAAGGFRAGLMLKEAIRRRLEGEELRPRNQKKRKDLSNIKAKSSLPLRDQYLFDARFLLAMGRADDAVPFLQKYADEIGATEDLLTSLAEGGSELVAVADRSEISSIVKTIEVAYMEGELGAFAAGARLASLFENESLARCVLDAAIAIDVEEYVLANEDVAGSGIEPFEHFVQFGFAEGRLGFARTLEAFELLSARGAMPRFVHRGLTRYTIAAAEA